MVLSISCFSRGMSSSPSVPTSPPDFLEDHISIDSPLLAVTATTFQSSDYQSSRLSWWNSRESGNSGGQVAHDVTDGEGAVFQKDTGKVVLGQKAWRDSTNGVEICQTAQATSSKATLGLILSLCVFHSIFKVNVRVDVDRSGRSQSSSRGSTLVGLRRERWRDGVGRRRETASGLPGRKGSCGHCSEAIFAGPEVIMRLGDVDRLRHSSQSQSDARGGSAGRSHVVEVDECIFCLC